MSKTFSPYRNISIIVPTFKEVENIPKLIANIQKVFESNLDSIELIIVDDDSQDGTRELIYGFEFPWVKIIERKGKQGLSSAVLEGLKTAKFDFFVVMDADLSHNPESIPRLIECLNSGAEFAVGSRYVNGGSTADDWGFLRWLNSRIATLLARPFTNIKDPMSGFFSIRRETFNQAKNLNPIGYKIGLELIVKCQCTKVQEIPIHFSNRLFGKSKLTFKEQIAFLKHIRRLWMFKYGLWSEIIQFAVVGITGVVTNLIVISLLLALGIIPQIAIATGIAVSILTNFLLNRRYTFVYGRHRNIFKQFINFVGACAIGALVNYGVSICILIIFTKIDPRFAAIFGIAAGAVFNYLSNRFFVFKRKYYRREALKGR